MPSLMSLFSRKFSSHRAFAPICASCSKQRLSSEYDQKFFSLTQTRTLQSSANCSRLRLLSSHKFVQTNHRFFNSSGILSNKNYYEILGVSEKASAKEIKKAYYELAKKNHPDVAKNDPNASKKFAEISEAYEVLEDENKRAEYDASRRGGFGGSPFGGAGGAGNQWEYQSNINPEELFRNIFGGGLGFEDQFESASFPKEYVINLTFKEACLGVKKDFDVHVKETCKACKGTKAEPGTKVSKCRKCKGTGMETFSQGGFIFQQTCRYCRGKKVVIEVPCGACSGTGSVESARPVVVPVPPGVVDDQRMRMVVGREEVFIRFHVMPSSMFKRIDFDIYSDIEVSISQAVLGGVVHVGGLYDTVRLRIPKGTSSHEKFKITGKGVQKSRVGDSFGDHFVTVKIKVPTTPTDIQRALMAVFVETDPSQESVSGAGVNLDGVPIQLVDAIKSGFIASGSKEKSNINEESGKDVSKQTVENSSGESSSSTDDEPQASKG